MKTKKWLVMPAMVLAFGMTVVVLPLAGCDNGSTKGNEPQTVKYESKDASGTTYSLTITEKTGRAVYAAKAGDSYELIIVPSGATKTSRGTVQSTSGGNLTLTPSGATVPFTVTGGNMTGISGTITLVDGGTEAAPAGSLMPVDNGGSTGETLAVQLARLKTNATSDTVYTLILDNDEEMTPNDNNELSYSGKTGITIRLRGGGTTAKTVALSGNGSLFTVESGVTLQGHSDNDVPLVRVNSGGTLVMNTGAKITGNNAYRGNSGGGGVSVRGDGTFTMEGGEISGNSSSSSYGGGVLVGGYLSEATFTMNGGKISGNTASSGGGGVHVSWGTFTMNGGVISGNTAYSASGWAGWGGGGVYSNAGNFTMNGGEIFDNTADSGGGGVRISSGTFTMTEGKISGNTSLDGGGVYVADPIVYFTMSGGEISGNTAAAYGGGVYVSNEPFTKTGGTIYGYSAGDANSNRVLLDNAGHAVYLDVNASTNRRRETTAGPSVNLSYGYDDNGLPVWSGGWEN